MEDSTSSSEPPHVSSVTLRRRPGSVPVAGGSAFWEPPSPKLKTLRGCLGGKAEASDIERCGIAFEKARARVCSWVRGAAQAQVVCVV